MYIIQLLEMSVAGESESCLPMFNDDVSSVQRRLIKSSLLIIVYLYLTSASHWGAMPLGAVQEMVDRGSTMTHSSPSMAVMSPLMVLYLIRSCTQLLDKIIRMS
jgi:hypothetical protein